MKNKEIISGIVGGAFFAIPYLGLSIAFPPSLIIALSAFGASELLISGFEKKEIDIEDRRTNKEIIETAKKHNNRILELIPQVEDKKTQEALYDINSTVKKIIDTIIKKPKKLKEIDKFFDYYLPVLVNIVERYDEIENQDLKSKEGKKFITSANKMIIEAASSFQNILDSLYESDIVDADAEMKVFNSMLKADGINNKGIVVESEEEDE